MQIDRRFNCESAQLKTAQIQKPCNFYLLHYISNYTSIETKNSTKINSRRRPFLPAFRIEAMASRAIYIAYIRSPSSPRKLIKHRKTRGTKSVLSTLAVLSQRRSCANFKARFISVRTFLRTCRLSGPTDIRRAER